MAIVAVIAVVLLRGQGAPAGQTAWARLGTADVHSLSFVGDGADHLLFGHHDGVLESRDGGRSWRSLSTSFDAMAMHPADDGSIVAAGHEVLVATPDGGATWAPIAADLPSLDIHGFTRDPADPARMWASLAIGGLWESRDFGAHWERIQEENVLFPVAIGAAGGPRLLGLGVDGLIVSDDGGRTWTSLATPPLTPFTSLAASRSGALLLAGGLDGLYRSEDGGGSWTKTPFDGQPFAIAIGADARAVAIVTKATDLFRSPDAGTTWPGP